MKIEGYSNYEIYPETGQIWNYKSSKYVGSLTPKGYIRCTLYNDKGKQKKWLLHRLIWTAVNGEIPEGMQVNHIDEDKTNNTISNLNLMTNKENSNWGCRTEKIKLANTNGKCSKPVLALKNGEICVFFPSTSEACRNGYCLGNISSCCNGIRKTHKGYQWQYVDDYLADWWDKEMEKAA